VAKETDGKKTEKHLAVLRALLDAPTAPFHEDAVIEQVRRRAAACGIGYWRDSCGNVVLSIRRGRSGARWVFEAHMDHPGFVVQKAAGRVVHAEFRGGVQLEYFPGAPVRFFGPGGPVKARVLGVRQTKKSPFIQCRLEIARAADLPAGTVGMWDFPPLRIAGRRLHSRACDDVVGAAAVLCAMEALAASTLPCDVTALLTRGEEAGFIGALGACEARTLHKDSLVVAIETSRAQPGGPMGSGMVVRVGDKTRTFDPSLTAHISAVAASLARQDEKFRFTRQLMAGGTTEATAYLMYGYTAAALCLPMANYHNMGPRGKIAAEQVNLDDFESLVKLLTALGTDPGRLAETDENLRHRLRELFQSLGGYL
jgi:endoglucanase